MNEPVPTRRFPILATVLVALAVAAMIGLGIWQIQRAHWKEGLLARFATARSLPVMAFPAVPPAGDALLFRRATGYCLSITGWSARAGRNRAGESGWRHIAGCRTGAEGPGMQVDFGWSNNADTPKAFTGGPVTGVITEDREHRLLLVAESPASGLQASMLPSPDEIPNNHRMYAVQWFAFAAIALAIYALALRRRMKRGETSGR